jgi:hypothetical protein
MTARQLHRRLAGVAALAVIGWALSGLAHPLMSLVGPRAVQFAPPTPPEDVLPAGWAAALPAAGVGAVAALRWVWLDGEALLQLAETADQPLRYAQHANGPFEARDDDYAVQLARHYTAHSGPVASVTHITAFSSAYPAVNRILPVWRVRFTDGREVEVSTREDRLVGYTDTKRRVLSAIFRNVHTLSPLSAWPWLRVPLMLALLIATWTVAFAGLKMALRRGARGRVRRRHRASGLLLMVPLLAWSGTGAFHLVHGATRAPEASSSLHPVAVADLPDVDLMRLRRLTTFQGAPMAQLTSGDYLLDGAQHTPVQAAQRIAGVAGQTDLVARFGDEYGFVNRRLPVWRVTGPDGDRYFVDLLSGQVVARAGRLDRAELWSLGQIHKWQWLDGLGRGPRDAVMSATALLLLGLAALGISLLVRGRRGSASP